MSVLVVMQQMGVIAILVAVGVYLYKKQVVDDTVEHVGGDTLVESSVGTVFAHHSHYVVAFAIERQHLSQHGWWILAVGVHAHYGVASGVVDAGDHSSLVAEVA